MNTYTSGMDENISLNSVPKVPHRYIHTYTHSYGRVIILYHGHGDVLNIGLVKKSESVFQETIHLDGTGRPLLRMQG